MVPENMAIYDNGLDDALDSLSKTGHEVGNHTYDHHKALLDSLDSSGVDNSWNAMISFLSKEASKDQWGGYIDSCSATIENFTNISADQIVGFRAPFLAYGTHLFNALAQRKCIYDCSIEAASTDKQWRWPYTLDNGSPDHNEGWKNHAENPDAFTIPATPGLWEMPVYQLLIPSDEECEKYLIEPGFRNRIRAKLTWMKEKDIHITGYDINLWHSAELNKAEFLGLLKYNLDVRLSTQGNRAPLFFGAHSEYYTTSWGDTHAPNATPSEMRAALTEFISYALSKQSVRMVPPKSIIDWMRTPEALGTEKEMAPTDIYISNNIITKGAMVVGNLFATDPNSSDTHRFEVLDGPFEISENTLKCDKYLPVGDHSVTIETTDQTDLSYRKSLTISVRNDADTLTTENLIGKVLWTKEIDSYGSTVEFTIDSMGGNSTGITADIDPNQYMKLANYCVAKLRAVFEPMGSLKNVTSIQIAYKADADFTVSLPTEEDEWKGFAAHMVTLPNTGGVYKSVVIRNIKDSFKKPFWTADAPLDLNKVRYLDFEVHRNSGDAKKTISIAQIKMLGYSGEVPVIDKVVSSKNNTISLHSLHANGLSLTVPSTGSYTVSLYGFNGRLLHNVNQKLVTGINSISLGDKRISSSAVLVKVSGNGKSAVSKMIVK